jgi:adenine phosphoribosyltransferase
MPGTASQDPTLAERIGARLRVVPDFPSKGIMFQDVTPVLADGQLFMDTIVAMIAPWRGQGITHVAGIESRGFIFAAPIALGLEAGFIPIRKPGKLPWRRATRDYALEYGSGQLEMHEDACPAGARVLIVDDVLATGGTSRAACELVEAVGGEVVGCGFLLEIGVLKGREQLRKRRVDVLIDR